MFKGFSISGRIAIGIAILIMTAFFNVELLVILGILKITYNISLFGFLCIISFIPIFFIIVREIIKKQKNEKIEKRAIESLLNESALISRADTKGRITHVNDKFCFVSGYKKHELLGKDHSMLNSGKHPREFWNEMYISTVVHKTIWHNIVTNKNKRGEEYIVDSYVVATFNESNKHTGYISVRQDITELMNSLKDVDRKNSYLEHAAKILRHDMHSGINTYIPRGITSLERRLEKLECDDIDKQLQAPMRLLKEGLAHAQKVYNGVKEFTNLVKKDSVLSKTPLDVKQSIRNFLKTTSYNSQVVVEELGIFNINESLFCTAVDNLIRNGLRYNDNETKYIKIYKEHQYIVVEDNGRGMSQEEFEELSKPYTRKEDNKESGSGLGLNICTAIMKEHGFSVECERIETGTKIKIKVV